MQANIQWFHFPFRYIRYISCYIYKVTKYPPKNYQNFSWEIVMFPNEKQVFPWKNKISNGIFIFQLLGECHCWWIRESLRTHVAKFYGQLRLIRSVLRVSKCSELTLIEIVILWVYYTIPFGFSLFRHLRNIAFYLFKLLCLAKDH